MKNFLILLYPKQNLQHTWRLLIMSIEKFTENLIYSQVFSFEVLNYYDSISTKENINWIIKYFNLLIKK